MLYSEFIVILILITIISLIVLNSSGYFNTYVNLNENKTDSLKSGSIKVDGTDNYISPKEFSVGLISNEKCTYMNNCIPNVRYPITGLSPEYGNKMPDNCRCNEFIQPP